MEKKIFEWKSDGKIFKGGIYHLTFNVSSDALLALFTDKTIWTFYPKDKDVKDKRYGRFA